MGLSNFILSACKIFVSFILNIYPVVYNQPCLKWSGKAIKTVNFHANPSFRVDIQRRTKTYIYTLWLNLKEFLRILSETENCLPSTNHLLFTLCWYFLDNYLIFAFCGGDELYGKLSAVSVMSNILLYVAKSIRLKTFWLRNQDVCNRLIINHEKWYTIQRK